MANHGKISSWQWLYSLRFRLTAWYSGALAIVLALASLSIYLAARHTLRAETDGFLLSEYHRIIAVSEGTPGDPADPSDISTFISAPEPVTPRQNTHLLMFDTIFVRAIPRYKHGVSAESLSLQRQPTLLLSLNKVAEEQIASSGRFDFAGPNEEQQMRIYSNVVNLAGQNELLQIAVPWDHNSDILERLALLLTVLVSLIVPATVIGGWILIGKTLQPITRIVTEADRIDASSLPDTLLPAASETDSEVGQLVTTLNRMITRLRHSFEAQRRFTADASHELRTPLTILRGEMELALSRPRSDEFYQLTLTSAIEEIARMSRIVESLGALARRDAGQEDNRETWGNINICALSDATVDEFTPLAALKQISLIGNCDNPAPLIVQGDADQLLQLMRNLVDNAIKYTPAGGTVKVTVEAQKIQGDSLLSEIILSVKDTGVGIAPEDIPNVFTRFWRADRSRSGSGSGLGLALCAEIAAAHGGRLLVNSELGKGSEFTLILPRSPVRQDS